MKEKLLLFKKIACVGGILFIMLGLLPLPFLNNVGFALGAAQDDGEAGETGDGEQAEQESGAGGESSALDAGAGEESPAPEGEPAETPAEVVGEEGVTLDGGEFSTDCWPGPCIPHWTCPTGCGKDPSWVTDSCGFKRWCPGTFPCCEWTCPTCGSTPAWVKDSCGFMHFCAATDPCPCEPEPWTCPTGCGVAASVVTDSCGVEHECVATEACQDCVGEWSKCKGECGSTGKKTFTVLIPGDPGGLACEAEDGATKSCQTKECDGSSTVTGGGTSLTLPGGAGGPTEELIIIPVTGVDLGAQPVELQRVFLFFGLALFGVSLVLEGVVRKIEI